MAYTHVEYETPACAEGESMPVNNGIPVLVPLAPDQVPRRDSLGASKHSIEQLRRYQTHFPSYPYSIQHEREWIACYHQ
jgi:hypothetical protein